MRFSWLQPWYGVREIPFTIPLSVSTNGYGRQLDARGFLSFHAGSRNGPWRVTREKWLVERN
jgi:hypothetical protein